MGSARKDKVAKAIQAAVADFLTRFMTETAPGFITVSQVKMSDDLKLASVYFSILGGDDKIDGSLAVLEHHKGRIRYHVGQEVPLKYVPELRFFHDDTMAYMDHMNRIIRKLMN
ncbi:MAG: 30S ribosome-binding factor RbfA [Lentisphaeria bacterium]|nr:30S ribosome-binding factor RbfA [Candidatus Neomarinimicrobiota bacterium]MCF7841660.1 30S ribosome-binding factor RbfA [Lentisphaeria bacterium]